MKKGRISKKEEAFIEQSIGHLTNFEIAEKLDRDPDSIQAFIKKKFKVGLSDMEEASYDLKERPYWSELKNQFTDEELEMFEYHWTNIIAQFKDDVAHTEELQVIDLCKMELLMNRSLAANKENLVQSRLLKSLLHDERQLDPDQQDTDRVFNYERQISSMNAAMDSLGRDYRDLQDKKNKMLKDMKATREQRIKKLEDKNQTFKGWITWLISNPDKISEFGKAMEKRRLAMLAERERLSKYHKYEDGMVDQPFLNSDSVITGDEDEKDNTVDTGESGSQHTSDEGGSDETEGDTSE